MTRRIDLRVIGALHTLGGAGYGLDLIRTARLSAGRLYPALERLERVGWVVSVWEDTPPVPEVTRRVYNLVALSDATTDA